MKLSESSLTAVLDAFRAPTPTPGGGSAAALAGALGASLLAMVAGLPKPRTSTAVDVQRLRDALSLCSDYARRLEALVDQDADAYLAVVAAYRLPKESDPEKQARSAQIQEALKAATATPLETMRLCWSALAEADAVSELGNASAASDVGVALELLTAGLRSARLNVEINLEGLRDQAYAARIREEVAALSR